ncbi:hypothetical protein DAI22_05g019200 [Oryza sativa Japonica Group]|nr:hypothetical protein DAI22_05g019200 [Oryza sativa Japonica Group]
MTCLSTAAPARRRRAPPPTRTVTTGYGDGRAARTSASWARRGLGSDRHRGTNRHGSLRFHVVRGAKPCNGGGSTGSFEIHGDYVKAGVNYTRKTTIGITYNIYCCNILVVPVCNIFQ